jgi:MOSC domain-containing protein YiiM
VLLQEKIGKVLQLYISTGNKEDPRKVVDSLHIDPNGVVGDKFYAKDSNRAILLTSLHSYNLAKEKGIDLTLGGLGENIFIDINPYNLPPQSIITIGNISFEVTQHCTLCKGLSSIDHALPKLLKHDRGIFIRALTSGTLSVQDTVKIQS